MSDSRNFAIDFENVLETLKKTAVPSVKKIKKDQYRYHSLNSNIDNCRDFDTLCSLINASCSEGLFPNRFTFLKIIAKLESFRLVHLAVDLYKFLLTVKCPKNVSLTCEYMHENMMYIAKNIAVSYKKNDSTLKDLVFSGAIAKNEASDKLFIIILRTIIKSKYIAANKKFKGVEALYDIYLKEQAKNSNLSRKNTKFESEIAEHLNELEGVTEEFLAKLSNDASQQADQFIQIADAKDETVASSKPYPFNVYHTAEWRYQDYMSRQSVKEFSLFSQKAVQPSAPTNNIELTWK